jgi:hypothetical protein
MLRQPPSDGGLADAQALPGQRPYVAESCSEGRGGRDGAEARDDQA